MCIHRGRRRERELSKNEREREREKAGERKLLSFLRYGFIRDGKSL